MNSVLGSAQRQEQSGAASHEKDPSSETDLVGAMAAVTTIAGSGEEGFADAADGGEAQFHFPMGIASMARATASSRTRSITAFARSAPTAP